MGSPFDQFTEIPEAQKKQAQPAESALGKFAAAAMPLNAQAQSAQPAQTQSTSGSPFDQFTTPATGEAPAKYPTPPPPKEEPGFVPSIGGVVPKSEETWSNPKYIAARMLSDPITRGVPGVRDLIPITETQQKLAQQHSFTEGLGNATGKAASMIPAAIATGGMGILGMGANTAANIGIGAAGEKLHNPNISNQELKNNAILDAIGTIIGQGAAKAVSPWGAAHRETLDQAIARSASLKSAQKWLGDKVDKITNPALELLGLSKYAKNIANPIMANQISSGSSKAAVASGVNALTSSELKKLEALKGGQ